MPLLSEVWYKMPREMWAWRKGLTGHKTPTAFHDVPVITTTTSRNCSLPAWLWWEESIHTASRPWLGMA